MTPLGAASAGTPRPACGAGTPAEARLCSACGERPPGPGAARDLLGGALEQYLGDAAGDPAAAVGLPERSLAALETTGHRLDRLHSLVARPRRAGAPAGWSTGASGEGEGT